MEKQDESIEQVAKSPFATMKHPSKMKKTLIVVHSGLAKLISKQIDVQVPESKIIKNGVELFKE